MNGTFGTPVLRRLLASSVVCLLALLAFAAAASASTITNIGNNFFYTAPDGDFNDVTVTYSGTGTFELTDLGSASIDVSGSGGRCQVPDDTAPNAITCDGDVASLAADLGDQDDYFDAFNSQGLGVVVNGGGGYDDITGSPNPDSLHGGPDSDIIDGGAGADTLAGGGDSDTIYDGAGADSVTGDDGDDFFQQDGTKDVGDNFNGGDGSDRIYYAQRSNPITVDLTTTSAVNGEASESDVLANVENVAGSNTAANTITGNDQRNELYGGDGIDTMTGSGGDDLLYGDDGPDNLSGGDGFDELHGVNGADTLNGGNDGDYLTGSDGGDTINGDAGDDEIDPGVHYTGATPGSDGVDTVDGGAGNDLIEYFDRTAPVTIDLSGGDDGSLATTSNGQSGEHDSIKNIENAIAGEGADTVTGNSANNVLYDIGGAGDVFNALGGDDEIDTRDGQVDTANCGDGNDRAFVDVAGEFSGTVSDNVSGCETVNSDYTPPPVENTPPTNTTTTTPPATNTAPPATNSPAPIVITAGAFVSKTQLSPKADTVGGSANIPADGSNLQVDLLYNGKLAKVTVVGKLVRKGLKKGVYPFKVKLNKKAAKLARKKGKKGLKLTVKVTIKPPTGSATVKTFKVTVKKGKAPACFRIARARAHTAC